jgi:methylated-DNA-protein-cysteine methyltransferase-like protein
MKPTAGASNEFFLNVYEVVELIPYGRVTSYSAIGRYLGSARSARMVGWAMNAACNTPDFPAHRVVNRAGVLTGKHHFIGESMQSRLEREGITVMGDQIQDFERVFWDPALELSL